MSTKPRENGVVISDDVRDVMKMLVSFYEMQHYRWNLPAPLDKVKQQLGME